MARTATIVLPEFSDMLMNELGRHEVAEFLLRFFRLWERYGETTADAELGIFRELAMEIRADLMDFFHGHQMPDLNKRRAFANALVECWNKALTQPGISSLGMKRLYYHYQKGKLVLVS
ncbi:MAG: hypothetical protein WC610_02395 [Patescibacteria group bacterium]